MHVDEEISHLANHASQKNIQIENNVSTEKIIVADKNMISNAIRNILNNAIKFSYENGKIVINMEEANEHLILSIKDYGKGISEEIKEKIFDISDKTSTLGTAGEKGTGLGLNLAKEFIELNNGEISFVSSENEGTTFYMKLVKFDEVING
jgi:signal transduction histidine kinase